jgi:hypothetical protein
MTGPEHVACRTRVWNSVLQHDLEPVEPSAGQDAIGDHQDDHQNAIGEVMTRSVRGQLEQGGP